MEFDLLSVILILLLGRTLGLLFDRLKLHSIIGEVLAGVILGFAFASIVHPSGTLEIFSTFGILMLMLLAGLITDFDSFQKHKTDSILVGTLGVVFSFAMLFFPLYWLNVTYLNFEPYKAFISALFIAAIVSNTAIEVSAKLLMKSKKRRVRTIIMGAAFIDDIIAVFLIGIVSSFALSGGGLSSTQVLFLSLKVILFIALSFIIGVPIVEAILDRFTTVGGSDEKFALTLTIILTFTFAVIARWAGIHEVIGAYIAGLLIGKWGTKVDPMLRRRRVRDKLIDDIDPPLRAIFSPLFFGYVGVMFAFQLRGADLNSVFFAFVLVIAVVAVLGKVLGCGLGALLMNMKKRSALLIGVGMCGRGALELVLINYGVEAGIIAQTQFLALVVVTLITIIITPILYNLASKYSDSKAQQP
jgi:Kef-type K+ transport system membrane component KefB